MRRRVRKLKAYDVEDAEIEAAMNDDAVFPQLTVTEDYRIVLTMENSVEVMMEPLVKAVYILFLSHPEGIILKTLPDYREELTAIYTKVRRGGMTEKTRRSIEDVTNPLLNSINEKCARIRKAFVDILDKSTAEHYYIIKGKRGEAKRISLPKNLIIWETGQTLLEKKHFHKACEQESREKEKKNVYFCRGIDSVVESRKSR